MYSDNVFPEPPVFETLQAHRTKMFQLGAIFQDEGTLEGTYSVHDEIWKKQFGFEPDGLYRSRKFH